MATIEINFWSPDPGKFLQNPDELRHHIYPTSRPQHMEEQMVSEEEINRRSRQGKLAGALAIIWWIASIGGIIWVINANA
ncbi:MAG: hypothetical protein JXQ99_19560 [Hyphomicrobiaceae bacterium]